MCLNHFCSSERIYGKQCVLMIIGPEFQKRGTLLANILASYVRQNLPGNTCHYRNSFLQCRFLKRNYDLYIC